MSKISIMLITYKRTQIALRTIEALRKYLIYPPELLHWHIADDGSPAEHIRALTHKIGACTLTNSNGKGVGTSMNLGMETCLAHSDYILWLEDDWELLEPFNVAEYIEAMKELPGVGMIRLGYISPGIRGQLLSAVNRLWWKLDKGPQYTFTGHASLRSKEFCKTYGHYRTDLSPGATELFMCGKFNNSTGDTVAIPADKGIYGIFAHIGSESYKDKLPE